MQDVNHAGKLDGIDGTVSIAVEIIDDFKDTPATKSLERLGVWVLFSVFGVVDRLSHYQTDILGKFPQIVF